LRNACKDDRDARAREPERVERERVVIVKGEQQVQQAERDDEVGADSVDGSKHELGIDSLIHRFIDSMNQ
jgi:hypothetical protein